MSYNGSGTYNLYTPGNPVVTGTTISSTWANNTLTDIASALSSVITKDGQTTTTAIIPFAQGVSSAALVDISASGAGQIKFPATKNASADANTLDDYQEGSVLLTATGMTTSPTGRMYYTVIGNTVIALIPLIQGTSNSVNFAITGLSAEITPASLQTCMAIVQDNSAAAVAGVAEVGSAGSITFGANLNTTGGFTASGTKACRACTISWRLNP